MSSTDVREKSNSSVRNNEPKPRSAAEPVLRSAAEPPSMNQNLQNITTNLLRIYDKLEALEQRQISLEKKVDECVSREIFLEKKMDLHLEKVEKLEQDRVYNHDRIVDKVDHLSQYDEIKSSIIFLQNPKIRKQKKLKKLSKIWL